MKPSDAPAYDPSKQAPLTPSQRMAWPIVIAIFVIGGLGLMIWGGVMVNQGWKSSSWPRVQAQVISASVSGEIRGKTGEKEHVYRPAVVYKYTVDGADYQNSKVYMAGERTYSSHLSAKSALQSLVGDSRTITISYEPSDPSNSVMVPGATLASYLLTLFGLALAAFPGIAQWYYVQRKKRAMPL